jgi:hypothetical protein
MAEIDRAAQFAPYAALSGFEEEVNEEARTTVERRFLDDSEIERLDERLRTIADSPCDVEAVITYFMRDSRKSGGDYLIKRGFVRKIDTYAGRVSFSDGTNIPISNITEVEIL